MKKGLFELALSKRNKKRHKLARLMEQYVQNSQRDFFIQISNLNFQIVGSTKQNYFSDFQKDKVSLFTTLLKSEKYNKGTVNILSDYKASPKIKKVEFNQIKYQTAPCNKNQNQYLNQYTCTSFLDYSFSNDNSDIKKAKCKENQEVPVNTLKETKIQTSQNQRSQEAKGSIKKEKKLNFSNSLNFSFYQQVKGLFRENDIPDQIKELTQKNCESKNIQNKIPQSNTCLNSSKKEIFEQILDFNLNPN